MKKVIVLIGLITCFFTLNTNAWIASLAVAAGLPVIPGAHGFGIDTPAGRGGTVYKVTSLADSGPGTLRECMEASEARVCVFEISGNIQLNSEIRLKNGQSYLTVAGQTAPPPGISVIRYSIVMGGAHDVLLQHIRFRIGDETSGDTDGLGVSQTTSHHFVFDHVSVAWGIDENIGLSHGANTGTVRYSIIGEALDCAGVHSEGCHSRTWLMSRSQDIFAYGNVLSSGNTRHPRWGKTEGYPHASAAVVNNVIYNWGGGGTQIPGAGQDCTDAGSENCKQIALVGNVYKSGPNSSHLPIEIDDNQFAVYLEDNEYNGNVPADPWSIVTRGGGSSAKSPPVWPTGFVAMPVSQVFDHILANAGARPADRDPVDTYIIDDIRQNNGRIINHQDDRIGEGGLHTYPHINGYPILAENKRRLTLPPNINGDDDGDGYTNLEEWLHAFAAEVERSGDTAMPPPNNNNAPAPPTSLRIIK
jgi:hypothetical protein